MNSVQESKNELDAAIRYAENAISSAKQTIESMEFRQEMAKNQHSEQTGREEALTKQVQELEAKVQGQYDDIVMLEREVEDYTQKYSELAQGMGVPTMPVIPKAVAIAIFREGMAFGVDAACTEIEGEEINVSETGYTGDFEVSFERRIDLDDIIDFDWVRSKIGDYDEDNVTAALEGMCADKSFECRIHGVDDTTIDLTKKND